MNDVKFQHILAGIANTTYPKKDDLQSSKTRDRKYQKLCKEMKVEIVEGEAYPNHMRLLLVSISAIRIVQAKAH